MTRRIAILGGGMAGLSAACSLSAADHADELEITVYQRGWRLGGKGASSRGPHGRIEEHGLHVWLGYYDNAFRVMREVYAQLDREHTDPGCPIATWREAFLPEHRVGVEDLHDGEWSHWVATFAANDREPGDPSAAAPAGPPAMAAFFEQALRLLLEFSRSIRSSPAPEPAAVVLSGEPVAPRRPTLSYGDFAALLRQTEIAATIAIVESLRLLDAALPAASPPAARLCARLERIRFELVEALEQAGD